MKRAFGRLGKSCLFLLAIIPVCLCLLIQAYVMFCLEENTRGARIWQLTKTELEARGESFDPAKFIPPPVPDAQNFGALPFFKVMPIPDGNSKLEKASTSKTMAGIQDLKDVVSHLPFSADDAKKEKMLPYLGNWMKSEEADPDSLNKLIAHYRNQKPGASVSPDAKPSDVFALICPSLAELRSANATHPFCRFNLDYGNPQPWKTRLGPITAHISLAKVLGYDEQLAFLSGNPGLALDDLLIAWKIDSGIRQEPMLVGGLVAIGFMAINLGVVNQGLANHVWNDSQLASLDEDLGKIDILSECQLCLRGEPARYTVPASDENKAHRYQWMKESLPFQDVMDDDGAFWRPWGRQLSYWVVPSGWIDIHKASNCLLVLSAARSIDPVARRVYPLPDPDDATPSKDIAERGMSLVSYNLGSLCRSVKQFAFAQVHIDEARIACRIERYRLAHGTYPETLDALVPAYGSRLPHDILNGQLYHYRVNFDQTYILYSVGWNLVDDGGESGSHRNNSNAPDWVWANYPDITK